MSKKKPSAKELYAETDGHLKELDCISKLMFTKQFPDCNGKMPKDWDPRYVSARENKFVADEFLWIERALAIYEVEGNVERFAINLALAVRHEAFSVRKEDTHSTSSAFAVLEALAVNDRALIDRIYSAASYPKKRDSRYPYGGVIANAIRAGLKGGVKAMQSVLKERPKKSAEGIHKGHWQSLNGIATNDASLFKQGILEAVREDRAIFDPDPDRRTRQSFRAAGLLKLAHWVNPEVLEGFHWKKLPPWYRDLLEWAKTKSLDFSELDLRRISIDLHKVWIELEKPHWLIIRKSMFPKKNQPPMFGLSQEVWKIVCDESPFVVESVNRETEYLKILCNHYKLPGRTTKYFGGLMPNLAAYAQDIVDKAECKKLNNGRRFENEVDYYIVNPHKKYLIVYCACLGSLGREHLNGFKTKDEAVAAAELKISWLKKKGFKEVLMATPEFAIAEKLSKQNKPIPVGFSEEDSDEFEMDFAKHWSEKMAAREKAKTKRPKARLKADAKPLASDKTSKKLASSKPAKTKDETAKTSVAKTNPSPRKPASAGKPNAASKANFGFRRFELIEGNSSKFWEIARDGNAVTTKWGRIGSDGQSKEKLFADDTKSQLEYDKLLREKTSKGYSEV